MIVICTEIAQLQGSSVDICLVHVLELAVEECCKYTAIMGTFGVVKFDLLIQLYLFSYARD